MNFELTDEQKMLAETVGSLLGKRYDLSCRAAVIASDRGWSPVLWQDFADLGLLGLAVDETYGGAGMGPDEVAVVMRALGRCLSVEPYAPTVVVGAPLVARQGTSRQRSEILPEVVAGRCHLALAHLEPGTSWSRPDVATRARHDGTIWRLTGEKCVVIGGASAQRLIVSAQTPSGALGLFLTDAEDVQIVRYRTHDGANAADIAMRDAPAEALGDVATGDDALAEAIDTCHAMLCAEAVGAMERAFELTLEYLTTREQFGRPIGRFQALQFRATDMYVSLELAQSMARLASVALNEPDVARRRQLIRAAKVHVDGAARRVTHEAVQLHGGIGMTAEYPVGHYLKRVAVISRSWSDADDLVERIAAAGSLFS